MSFLLTEEAASLLVRVRQFLAARSEGGELSGAFLVGGYLRDLLAHRLSPRKDLDFAICGDALQMARELADEMGGAYVALDPERQVGRAVLSWNGERWLIDFTGFSGDLHQELARRDFTVNAMAVPLASVLEEEGGVTDPFGGLEDLRRKHIRALNGEVFQADPVRLLRAVRLAGELGFILEPMTKAQTRRDASLLTQAAAERLREEFCRILSLHRAGGLIRVLDQLGLLTVLFPELLVTKGVEQPKEHYWDVFNHSLETVSAVEVVLRAPGRAVGSIQAEVAWTPELAAHFREEVAAGYPRSMLVKLAGLFHDIAKPQTKTIEPGGRVRFLGHPQLGAEITGDILRRLRFSRQEVRMVEQMVLHHLRPGLMSGDLPLPTQRAMYRYYRDTGEVGVATLYLNLADYLAARGPRLDPNDWRDIAGKIRYVLMYKLQQVQEDGPSKLVSGDDLLQSLDLTPGPLVGRLLEGIREAQAAGEVATKKEGLSYAEKLLRDMVSSEGEEASGVRELRSEP